MSKSPKVVYPSSGSDSYQISFDDSFSRKPHQEQISEIREKLAVLFGPSQSSADQ